MLNPEEIFSFPPYISIIDLLKNFNQSGESRKTTANQFSKILMNLLRGFLRVPGNEILLDNQQINTYLLLISTMICQEVELLVQLDNLKLQLQRMNIVPVMINDFYDISWIGSIEEICFNQKNRKIYSEADQQALFFLNNGVLNCNTLFFNNVVDISYAYTQISNYLKSRFYDIACSLSTFFQTLCGQKIDIIKRYVLGIENSRTWERLLEFIGTRPSWNINSGIFWFHIAIHYANPKLFLKWTSLGGQVSELDETARKLALQFAINCDSKEIFNLLILKGVIPTPEDITNVKQNVAALLDYQPGRRRIKIRDYLHHPQRNLELLKLMCEDENDTSDEDSSDEEAENFQLVNNILPENKKVLVRGINYTPGYFDARKRQQSKTVNDHRKNIYARATAALAETLPRDPTGLLNFEHADQLIKNYFELLKYTPDRPELDQNYKRKNRSLQGITANFGSLYYHFIQAYVNSYQSLFAGGGMVRNFNFFTNHNPLISTTPNITVAFRYASGERINHDVRYFPKVRRSTGELKHHCLGYVEVYLLDEQSLQKYSVDINQLKQAGRIGVTHNYSFNEEVVIEASIPDACVLGFQIFSLPRMNTDWVETIEEKYGLNKTDYDNLRLRLRNEKSKTEIEKILVELILKVTEKQAQRLQAAIQRLFPVNLPPTPIVEAVENVTESLVRLNIINP